MGGRRGAHAGAVNYVKVGAFRAMIHRNIARFIRSRGGFASDLATARRGAIFDPLDADASR